MNVAGDGTTTATILALAIYQEGLRNIAAGANPMAVKRGIDKAVEAVLEHVEKIAVKLSSKKEIAQVAAISANNDKFIGDKMANAFERVGKDALLDDERGSEADHLTVRLLGQDAALLQGLQQVCSVGVVAHHRDQAGFRPQGAQVGVAGAAGARADGVHPGGRTGRYGKLVHARVPDVVGG